MKWKLTGRYLVSVVLIVVIVIIMNIVVVIGLFILQSVNEDLPILNRQTSAESISRSFQEHIVITESGASISEKGKEILEKNQAWVQILDEDGGRSTVILLLRRPKRSTPPSISCKFISMSRRKCCPPFSLAKRRVSSIVTVTWLDLRLHTLSGKC